MNSLINLKVFQQHRKTPYDLYGCPFLYHHSFYVVKKNYSTFVGEQFNL